jgi:hypothetical protein
MTVLLAAIVAQASTVTWERDHAAALQRAAEFRKPVLMYFRAAG